MVIDTSALLTLFFKQPGYDWVIEQMNAHAGQLRMSTVNLTETLIHLQDRQPQLFETLETTLLQSGIRFVAPDIQQSRIAAEARLRFPLNLGDCFAYALAKNEGCALLCMDRDFRAVDITIVQPK